MLLHKLPVKLEIVPKIKAFTELNYCINHFLSERGKFRFVLIYREEKRKKKEEDIRKYTRL